MPTEKTTSVWACAAWLRPSAPRMTAPTATSLERIEDFMEFTPWVDMDAWCAPAHERRLNGMQVASGGPQHQRDLATAQRRRTAEMQLAAMRGDQLTHHREPHA